MPVLRPQVPDHGTQPRPCRAAQPGRSEHLGKYRLRVRKLQRPQGRPNAKAGAPESHPQAGKAQAQSAPQSEVDPPEISVVANVPGQRVLVGGVELENSAMGTRLGKWTNVLLFPGRFFFTFRD